MKKSIFFLLLFLCTCGDSPKPKRVKILNFVAMDKDIFSGSQPKTEAIFKELKLRGVKSILSVDASRPNSSL
jgi:hypothetical protein